MSIPPRINLPVVPRNHVWDDSRLQLFFDEDGKLLLPPNFFSLHVNRLLNKLAVKEVDTATGAPRRVLTEEGKRWTEDAWDAWPFFDSTQRDEMHRPYHKYEKTSENQLRFAVHMQTYFSTSMAEYTSFSNHLHSSLQDEIIRRVNKDSITMPSGDQPGTIQDVLTILQSEEMKQLFRTNKDELYTYIFRWIKSITFEDSISWVEAAIEEYFQDNCMLVRMASAQTSTTRRHSIVRIAVDKGTQTIKEKFKYVEEKAYGWKLDMSLGVYPHSKNNEKLRTFVERMASENYTLVNIDQSLVPKSRKNNPAYWLKKTGTTSANNTNEEPNINGMLDVIVDVAHSSKMFSPNKLIEILQEKIASRTASCESEEQSESNFYVQSEEEMDQNQVSETLHVNVSRTSTLTEKNDATIQDKMSSLFPPGWDITETVVENEKNVALPSLPYSPSPCTRQQDLSGEVAAVAADDGVDDLSSDESKAHSSSDDCSLLNKTATENNPIDKEDDTTERRSDSSIATANATTPTTASLKAPNPITPTASKDEHDTNKSNDKKGQEFLQLRGGFKMWVCPNAIRDKWQIHDGMNSILLEEAKQRECAFALCNNCYFLSDVGTRSNRGSRKRKLVPSRNECNHDDLAGLAQETDHKWFTADRMKRHGCNRCNKCEKLIPSRK